MFVKADADGKVRIPAQVHGGAVAVKIQIGGAGGPGAPAGGAQVFQRAGAAILPIELKDLKDVSVTTTTGAKIDIAEATKRLSAGGFVLAPADGKAIAPEWLRLFRSERVLVVVSPDLVASGAGGLQVFQAIPAGIGGEIPIQPQPAPAPKKD